MEREASDQAAADLKGRLEKIAFRLIGGGAALPGELLAAKFQNDVWKLKPEEVTDLGEISALWAEMRLKMSLDKPWMVDVLFLIMLLKVYVPRAAYQVAIIKEAKAKKAEDKPKDVNTDADNAGAGAQGDGEDNGSAQSFTDPTPEDDS